MQPRKVTYLTSSFPKVMRASAPCIRRHLSSGRPRLGHLRFVPYFLIHADSRRRVLVDTYIMLIREVAEYLNLSETDKRESR